MFGNMKRYANGLAIFITQRNLDIHFAASDIFAEDPHLALFVKHVDDRTLNIILHLQIFYN